jgi:hypothetical protein
MRVSNRPETTEWAERTYAVRADDGRLLAYVYDATRGHGHYWMARDPQGGLLISMGSSSDTRAGVVDDLAAIFDEEK